MDRRAGGRTCVFAGSGSKLVPRPALVRWAKQVFIVLGSAAVGFVSGAVAQTLFFLFMMASAGGIGFFLGWLLLGGLLGWGMSFFIPNLDVKKAALAGLIGGGLGAIAFLSGAALLNVVGGRFGDVMGRLAGAVILGFCVGLMVAMVEVAFRQAWLEVRLGPREVVTVNLGPEPVRVGGDSRQCAVWARGAAPVAFRYWLRDGQVLCGEGEAGAGNPVRAGERRMAGSVEVVVQTGNSATPSPSAPAKPSLTVSASPRPTADAVAKTSAQDPFDDLPVAQSSAGPAAPPGPNPAAAPSAAAPPKPATPMAAPKPAVSLPVAAPASAVPAKKPPGIPSPQPKPAPPRSMPDDDDDYLPQPNAPAAGPEGCPSCNRKVPGRVGKRYCVMCDKTF